MKSDFILSSQIVKSQITSADSYWTPLSVKSSNVSLENSKFLICFRTLILSIWVSFSILSFSFIFIMFLIGKMISLEEAEVKLTSLIIPFTISPLSNSSLISVYQISNFAYPFKVKTLPQYWNDSLIWITQFISSSSFPLISRRTRFQSGMYSGSV